MSNRIDPQPTTHDALDPALATHHASPITHHSSLAVSTWSLHRALGPVYPGVTPAGDRPARFPYGAGSLTLLDAPAAVAALGARDLEICHFHFPRTDVDYLAALRERLAAAGVRLLTLLIDAGDISAADPAAWAGDLAALRGWIDVAAAAGARQVRVVAGEASPDDAAAIQRSVAGLAALAAYGRGRGVGVITENWRPLASRPAALLTILDGLAGQVGLCVDFGNLAEPTKYADLAALLPRATTIHAKARATAPGQMDEADFHRCLNLARASGYDGPYVLIFDGAGDERAGLARLGDLVRGHLADGN
ncbi:MAG: TIM barrel protein [Chloroflexi bacterium]|nr:TIM barrel protein [Chloroflexota bacterium]